MIRRKVDKIIKLTAELTNIPIEVVEDVIKQYFSWMREVLNNFTFPAIVLPHIGTFYVDKANLIGALRLYIKHLRAKHPASEAYKVYFKKVWGARLDMYNYFNKNKTLVGSYARQKFNR